MGHRTMGAAALVAATVWVGTADAQQAKGLAMSEEEKGRWS